MRLLALAVSFIAAVTAAAQPAGEVLAGDAAVLAQAGTMTAEQRRYLVYLYARLNRPHVAQALADTILQSNPGDRQTLLVLASMYVEQKDAAAVLRTARRFLQFYPDDHQGLYFLSAGHVLAKEFAAAQRILGELKQEQFSRRKYPYETDLAASAAGAGDWRRAMLSYQELLRHHDLGNELRDEVRRALDGIYREHLPRVELTAANTRLDRAEVWRSGALHGAHPSDRHWLDLSYARDAVSIDPAPGLGRTRAHRSEALANVSSILTRRWRTAAWAGVSREGVFGGGRLHRTFAPQREAALELAGNVRAFDSLALEALDGRQHQAALTLSWLAAADLVLTGRAQVRRVLVGGEELGRGKGIDLNVDYTVWREGPRITAGYRGSLAQFALSADAARSATLARPAVDANADAGTVRTVIGNLVSSRINRHGTGVVVADNLADAWVYRLTAGVDYDFELSSTGWNAAARVSFFPRRSIELAVEGGYTSSAVASNAGSAATQLNFFIRALY